MKLKRSNVYKVRWIRLINELKSSFKKFPTYKVGLDVMINTMENIEKEHLSKDIVSSRFILKKYPDMDRMRLKYGRDSGRLSYEKRGGMYYYKETDIVLWWAGYSKYTQEWGKK